MKTLLHTCCAPCSIYCVEQLKNSGQDVTTFWYNPNIHPENEYELRKNTLIEYNKFIDLPIEIVESYNLIEFAKKAIELMQKGDNRCEYCYRIRLEKVAKFAKHNGYDSFTTTLLVSPYQNHELLKQIGEEMSEKYGVKFYYQDFRIGFREGQNKSREIGLYRQKFCGCMFSKMKV